ncbi:MAG: tetratricopeptide repeat protein [Pirellulales bacterium]|nr:tetratricopeptide repeat protein [Pirellulales bacterium]
MLGFYARFFHPSIAMLAAAILLANGNFALGQPGGKSAGDAGTGKADPAAAETTLSSNPPKQPLTVGTLIGDAVGDPNSPQYQDVTDAITRAINGDFTQARQFLETAVKKNPNLPPPSVLMARLLFAARQVAAARTELEKAVREYPNDPEAYVLFAQLALGERQFTDAELLLQKAKALSDAYTLNAKRKRNFDINVASGLALVAESREQWDDAIAQAKKLLELDPESVAGHQRLGVYLFRQGKGEKAAAEKAYEQFKAAMKIDPKAIAEITLARLFQSSGEPEKAMQWIDYAVKLHKDNLPVELAAAQLAMDANRLDDAKKFADEAIRIDPDSPEAKLLRAAVARLAGDLPKAESLLEQLHLQFPGSVPAANMLAQVLVDQDDKKKQARGLELAQMNLKAQTEGNQTSRELLATLAWSLFRNGQTNQAENAMLQVLQSTGGQVSSDYAYYATKILLEPKGKYPEAIQILERSLKNPQPFAYRLPASSLLAELKKKPATTSTGDTAVPPIVPEVSPAPGPGTTLPGTAPSN